MVLYIQSLILNFKNKYMLNTIRLLKGVLNINLSFGWEISGERNFSREFIKDMNDEFIKKNKEAIKKWILENSWKDGFKDNIWLNDFSEGGAGFANLVQLVNKLDIKKDDYNVSVKLLLDKLNAFAGETKIVLSESRRQEQVLKQEVELSAKTSIEFNEKLDKRDRVKVRKLQEQLNSMWANLKVDGIFGAKTRAAYRKYLSNGATTESAWASVSFTGEKANVARSQFTGNTRETPLWDDGRNNISAWKVNEQIVRTGKSMEHMSLALQIQNELNGKLRKYFFADKRWYSIENLIRNVFGTGDKYSEILKDKNAYEALISQKWWKQKLERAVDYLIWKIDNKDQKNDIQIKETTEFVGKAWPWLAGIYLWDIPIPFMREIMPGADFQKSVSFKEWMESGMKEEFSVFYNKQNKEKINPLKEQISLINFLSRVKLDNNDQTAIINGNLNWLSNKTKALIMDYARLNLLPNMKLLREDSFHIFERWFDSKSRDTNAIIEKLQKYVDQDNVAWVLEMLNDTELKKFSDLLRQEGDTNMGIVDKLDNTNNYIKGIEGNERLIDTRFKPLFELWKEYANRYSAMMRMESLQDLKGLWLSANDKISFDKLLAILSRKPINKWELVAWEKANPRTKQFIEALWDGKKMSQYQLDSIPKSRNLKQVKVESKGAHWVKLAWDNNAEDLRIATTTSPEAKSWLSSLALAYRTFVKGGWVTGISYQDFENAFANKEKVDISSISSEKIVNTARQDGRWSLTSFQELARTRWDNYVFKMKLDKGYTYYWENGKVDVKVNYTLYIRPDCTNPILVPNTIKATKQGQPVPEADIPSLIAVNSKLPIIIPYNVIFRWGGSGGSGWKRGVSTKPGETNVGDANLTWTWKVPTEVVTWGWFL